MYGLLLENLAAFIKIQWGESKWDSVRKHAGVDVPSFSVHHVYAETLIPRLAKSACKVLDISEQAFFEAMGVYFVEFVGQYGYDQVLTVLGRHMRDFLNGLDNLHEYLKFSYPRMRAPSFFCENETADGLMLHYRSKRRGFVYYSMGQIRQVAKHFYNMDCDITIVSEGLDGDMNHVIFQLKFDNRAYSEAQSLMKIIREERQLPVRASLLFEIFPFCVAFCPEMIIRHTGHSLLVILKDLIGQCITQAFELTRPLISFNFTTILERTNNIFELITTAPLGYDDVLVMVDEDEEDDDSNNLKLRGQMLYMEDWNMILFLAVPVMPDLDGLTNTGLYLNDLSLHDCSRDLILVGTQQSAELKLALDQEQNKSQKLEASMKKLDDEMKRTDELLYQMIPKAVADRIRRGENLVDTCQMFESVSILFSDVVTFTEICSRITPMQVVSMLNHMYSLFDQLTERNGVYKVETIGDAYMVVSGAPEYDVNHAERICDMALDMIDASAGIRDPSQDNEHVKLRVGVHSGTVVAGVVGLKMPRYCLFGDAVNTASRLESTSLAGKVQISVATKDSLPATYVTEYRGEVAMKGKGDLKTFWLLSRRERIPLSELRCNSFSWAEPTINVSSASDEPGAGGPGGLFRSNSVGSSITDSLSVADTKASDGRRQTRSRSWSTAQDQQSTDSGGGKPLLAHQQTIESMDLDAAKRACASLISRSKSEESTKSLGGTSSKSVSEKESPDRPPTPSVTFKEPLTSNSDDVVAEPPPRLAPVPTPALAADPVPVPVQEEVAPVVEATQAPPPTPTVAEQEVTQEVEPDVAKIETPQEEEAVPPAVETPPVSAAPPPETSTIEEPVSVSKDEEDVPETEPVTTTIIIDQVPVEIEPEIAVVTKPVKVQVSENEPVVAAEVAQAEKTTPTPTAVPDTLAVNITPTSTEPRKPRLISPRKKPEPVKGGGGAVNQTQENFLLSKSSSAAAAAAASATTLNPNNNNNSSETAAAAATGATKAPPESTNNVRAGNNGSSSSKSEDRSRDPLLKRLRENRVALLTSEAMAQLGCSGFSAKQKEVVSSTCSLL